MAKKKDKITKKDPKKELSGWIDYKNRVNNNEKKRVSASLTKLQAERRHALLTRLGFIILFSLCCILALGYYVSPKANVASVQVKGAPELNSKQVVKTVNISPENKIVFCLLKGKEYNKQLSDAFPEIEKVQVGVKNTNHLILTLKERPVIGYIHEGTGYRKILATGKVGSQVIDKNKIDKNKPLFIGYNQKVSLSEDIKVYASLPQHIRDQVKMLSGETRRPTQIVLVMKDNNIVIGNLSTIKSKIQYYDKIKSQLKEPSVIDFEIGAYSRPLTQAEKVKLGLT
ncbi:cell division protein FtsQ/DivIB [Lactobacillus gasseri]|uniref:Cell division protein DivIB n=1 Tax=Lactobacillus gasseri TaxID=1596 RepID=A0ABY3BFJ4_LACGS|nr:cell division protein FtsQ/DivIB [Lactobacillus gasseri]KXA24612.1 cell division protein FtsQ [Lactobacillus gasseri]MBW0439082.1 cell division protein FtsQ/DivIB [Lactobacillus gasseri]MBW0440359.1 cell division protein FtsQ/DivIB [Lactobacillus gasseri]MBW0452072.1 cell division protein FtsQ/DivIB [Lactobacillus gasseri]MBW0453034.1 cell division protein FtsQ/DivIB [Lactobacillus gasseri]